MTPNSGVAPPRSHGPPVPSANSSSPLAVNSPRSSPRPPQSPSGFFRTTQTSAWRKVADDALHCVRVNEEGQLVAVGSHSGVITILELSGGFSMAAKNEKATMGAMLERETHREKILEARAKELRVKEKQRTMAEATAASTARGARPTEAAVEAPEKDRTEAVEGEAREEAEGEGEELAGEEQLSAEELLKKVEQEFFEMIEEERRKRERDNDERSRVLETLEVVNREGDMEEEEGDEEAEEDEGEEEEEEDEEGFEGGLAGEAAETPDLAGLEENEDADT